MLQATMLDCAVGNPQHHSKVISTVMSTASDGAAVIVADMINNTDISVNCLARGRLFQQLSFVQIFKQYAPAHAHPEKLWPSRL